MAAWSGPRLLALGNRVLGAGLSPEEKASLVAAIDPTSYLSGTPANADHPVEGIVQHRAGIVG
ncbi:hypothetical protein [Specibacter cremeus]|uniref:hypothetical protein n=1 Tax=Specibacter cremeus TaxID=1629051 RepID=UPI000F79B890|nr:hypothetical protein [Specibacter cremeus]